MHTSPIFGRFEYVFAPDRTDISCNSRLRPRTKCLEGPDVVYLRAGPRFRAPGDANLAQSASNSSTHKTRFWPSEEHFRSKQGRFPLKLPSAPAYRVPGEPWCSLY